VAYSKAVPAASMVLLQGMNMHALENVSVIVSIESYPSDKGSFTMKSMATEVKGSIKLSEGIGKRGGFGFVGLFFRD
jgi:hypothetical protein